MRISFVPLFFLALPLLEIAGFVLVGRQIGVLATIGLVIAAGVVGAVMLRIQGFGVMTRIRKELEAKRDPSRELAHGVMILLAGILLLIPGFITDMVGLMLFVPPLRDLAWRFVRSRVTVTSFGSMAGFGFGHAGGPGRSDKVIDLDAGDYSKARPDSPWTRIEHD